jgi:hypothetical protein
MTTKIAAPQPPVNYAYNWGDKVTVRYKDVLGNEMNVQGIITDRVPDTATLDSVVSVNVLIWTSRVPRKLSLVSRKSAKKGREEKYYLDAIPAGYITHSYDCHLRRIKGVEARLQK